eukprot:11224606-Lingulodinium_polyedra.AAC.1
MEPPRRLEGLIDTIRLSPDNGVQEDKAAGVEQVFPLAPDLGLLAGLVSHCLLLVLPNHGGELGHAQIHRPNPLGEQPASQGPNQHQQQPATVQGPPTGTGITQEYHLHKAKTGPLPENLESDLS